MDYQALYSPGHPGSGGLIMLNPDDYQVTVGFSGPIQARLPGILISYSQKVCDQFLTLARLMGERGIKPEVYFISRSTHIEVSVYFKLYTPWKSVRSLVPQDVRLVADAYHKPEQIMCVLHIAEIDATYEWFTLFYDLYRKAGFFLLQIDCLGEDQQRWETQITNFGWEKPTPEDLIQGLRQP